jgi:hypothetical protein
MQQAIPCQQGINHCAGLMLDKQDLNDAACGKVQSGISPPWPS